MKPTRDDLRIAEPQSNLINCDCLLKHPTDADLREMGYVKLDVDVDQVRAAATEKGWNDGLRLVVLVPFARQVLAALDGTEHTHGVVQQWCDECGELEVDDPDVAALDGEGEA